MLAHSVTEFPSRLVEAHFASLARDCHSTSLLWRVLRFLTSLRPAPARKGHADSTRAIHTRQLPSTQDVLTKSEVPLIRVVLSGIQPTGIPHVRCPCTNRGYVHATLTYCVSSVTTLGHLRTGSSYSLPPPRKTSSFSPLLAGMEARTTMAHDGTHTCVWHRCPKTHHFSPGRGDYPVRF